LARVETDFVLENDLSVIRAHVLYVQEDLARLKPDNTANGLCSK
jgi:hypothetical protein